MVYAIYWEALALVDQFTALRFMATGEPLAAKWIQILLMNQYA
jgi:hypothetical protein